jgi:hypothetical protein
MDQGLELSVWLGTAGLAIVGGNVHLWQTRRVLGRPRQAAAVPGVKLMPAAVTELASSVIAP